ncbi:MAG: DUF1566 domain-containing protein [bacterium]
MERFQATTHATIRDTSTGLEWRTDYATDLSWDEAMTYAAKLGDGWRLPTIEELVTLIDFKQVAPASEFPDQPSEWFWSSSLPRAASTSYAWYVHFNNGSVDFYDKTRRSHARCVRGGPSATPEE